MELAALFDSGSGCLVAKDVQHRARWLHRGEGPAGSALGQVQNFLAGAGADAQYPRLGRQRRGLQKKCRALRMGAVLAQRSS